ncbi:hypothetical protein X566_20085 [Afipia sp. P52-10]|uniref:hypothetical protein n=1 Tax=Afipia sp. P52-10 TaxID=1429916 RepID=UPI0003DF2CCF|nr:hypothetical protein [Afipia sp. P52-10]ETR75061.1 hypothetical protein X566_20085 [Afipia sp. P52-10]
MADRIFDLFGDELPANWGQRGRPEHVASQQNRNRVSLLVALGWSNARIAAALFITQPTLRKHYFSELKYREVARDRLILNLGMKLWEQVRDGNVGAMKEFQKYLERNDLMTFGQTAPPSQPDKPVKEQKLGKKEAAKVAAHQPDTGSTLGQLMAHRQQVN